MRSSGIDESGRSLDPPLRYNRARGPQALIDIILRRHNFALVSTLL
jgi:hypothetical protein